MKKLFIFLFFMLGLFLILETNQLQAYSYKISDSKLTIKKSGKSNFSKIKKTKSIKELVVKNGIKKLPVNIIKKLTNIEKLTVPGNIKFVKSDRGTGKKKATCFPVKTKLVRFSTPISDITNIEYYKTSKFVTFKKDRQFYSNEGNIYSASEENMRDILVGVPSEASVVNIKDKTVGIDFYSIMYVSKDIQNKKSRRPACHNLRKIIVPQSISHSIIPINKDARYLIKAKLEVKTKAPMFLDDLFLLFNRDYKLLENAVGNTDWIKKVFDDENKRKINLYK